MEILIAALVMITFGFFATAIGVVAIAYREPDTAKKALEVIKRLGK